MLFIWQDANDAHLQRYHNTIDKITIYKNSVSLDKENVRQLSFLFHLLNNQAVFLSTLKLTKKQHSKLELLKNKPDFLRVSNLYNDSLTNDARTHLDFSNQNKGITMEPIDILDIQNSSSDHLIPSYEAVNQTWITAMNELTSETNTKKIEKIHNLTETERLNLLDLLKKCQELQEQVTPLAKTKEQKKHIKTLLDHPNYIFIHSCIQAWFDLEKEPTIHINAELEPITQENTIQSNDDKPRMVITSPPPAYSREPSEETNYSSIVSGNWTPTLLQGYRSSPPINSGHFSAVKSQLQTIYDELFLLQQTIETKFNKNQALYKDLYEVFQPKKLLDQLTQALSLSESEQQLKEGLQTLLPQIDALVNDTHLNKVITTPRPQYAIQQYTLVSGFCQLLKALCGIIATLIYPAAAAVKYALNDATPVFKEGLYATFFSQTPASARKWQDIQHETDVLKNQVAQFTAG